MLMPAARSRVRASTPWAWARWHRPTGGLKVPKIAAGALALAGGLSGLLVVEADAPALLGVDDPRLVHRVAARDELGGEQRVVDLEQRVARVEQHGADEVFIDGLP